MLARLRAGQCDGHRQPDDDFRGWVKTTVLFLAVSGSTFMKFREDVNFQHSLPTVYIMFLAGDIGPQSCH